MNQAEEDYLKLIYELHGEFDEPFIKSSDLAEKFGYTIQSVNEMIKRMDRKGLLKFQPYKGVRLTEKGEAEALRMIRAHRIWEVFLSEKLGLSWEALHDEAEKLEHATSPLVLQRLYEYLGHPEYCNHGNPIPDADGNMKKEALVALHDAEASKQFRILRVMDHKPLLKYLNQLSLSLNDLVKIVEKDSFGGIVKIKKDDTVHHLSKNVASMIFGEYE